VDINQLDSFLNYKVDLNLDPEILVNKIIKKTKEYLKWDCEDKIRKAYILAKTAHNWQSRLSWEQYIIHPLKSTLILMDLKPDIESIQTCILHDVIEDSIFTKQEIEKEFGNEVATLCEWLVKVSKIKYKWEDRQLETIKKTFLAMAKDLRVIFVKLADRIHNMQTLSFHPKKEKRENIATETMKIYVPISKRLGLYHYQVTLENACFKILQPKDFESITWYLKKWFSGTDKYIKKWTLTISKLLQKEWLKNYSIKGRIKSPYRIREKMEYRYQTKDITSVMDLLAFRVITKDISDCYSTLWIIHKHYTPLIKKIKDYIAVPKFNWYKSIHTTILGMFRFPIEIQIRTQDMDDIAEFWVAAHYAYSDPNNHDKVNKKQAEWMKKLQELVNAYTESEEKDQFKNKLDIELLNKETFIYTPKWDIIEMPKWSTVLDFAFHIHTDIWLRFKNAIVNGEIVPITHIPNTWDIVKINTFRYQYTANKHWLSILKTSNAKYKILKFLKNNKQWELIYNSTKLLNEKLDNVNLPPLSSKENEISKLYNKKDLQKKLIDATENKTIYNDLIKNAYPDIYKKHIQNQKDNTNLDTKIKNKIPNNIQKIIVDEDKLINYYLCPECKPTYPQKIIAKTWRDGIKIHNLNCRALKTISPTNLLEAHRSWENKNIYTITSTAKVDKSLDLIRLLELFTKLQIEVNSFSIKDDTEDKDKIIKIKRTVKNPSQIGMIRDQIKKFGDLIKTIKRKIE
jgi:GTP diphosphokinase / guanosine-3',5'-bis(diphosphate) 3'-diphosphatase